MNFFKQLKKMILAHFKQVECFVKGFKQVQKSQYFSNNTKCKVHKSVGIAILIHSYANNVFFNVFFAKENQTCKMFNIYY